MPTPQLFTPLRHPAFRRLWAGQVLSTVGSAMFPVAVAVTVLRQGRDPSQLGVLLGAEMGAYVLVVLVGGVLADRFRRTRVMLGSDLISALAVLGFAASGAHAPLPVLVALGVLVGLASAFFLPAYSALIPHVVPAEDLQAANALRGSSQRLAAVAGPAIAGVLVVWAGPPTVFVVDAVTYAISAVTLFGLAEPRRIREASGTMLAEAIGGLRAVWERRWIAIVVLQGTAQLLLTMGPLTILVPIVLHARHQDTAYGWVVAAQALGSAFGGVVAARIRPAEPGTVAVFALLANVGELVCLAVPVPPVVFAASAVATGIGYSLFGALWFTALQREVPDRLLARVFAVEQLGTFALAPVAYVLAPVVAGWIGIPALVWFAIAMLLLSTVVVLPSRDVRRFSAAPAGRPTGPPARPPDGAPLPPALTPLPQPLEPARSAALPDPPDPPAPETPPLPGATTTTARAGQE